MVLSDDGVTAVVVAFGVVDRLLSLLSLLIPDRDALVNTDTHLGRVCTGGGWRTEKEGVVDSGGGKVDAAADVLLLGGGGGRLDGTTMLLNTWCSRYVPGLLLLGVVVWVMRLLPTNLLFI